MIYVPEADIALGEKYMLQKFSFLMNRWTDQASNLAIQTKEIFLCWWLFNEDIYFGLRMSFPIQIF